MTPKEDPIHRRNDNGVKYNSGMYSDWNWKKIWTLQFITDCEYTVEYNNVYSLCNIGKVFDHLYVITFQIIRFHAFETTIYFWKIVEYQLYVYDGHKEDTDTDNQSILHYEDGATLMPSATRSCRMFSSLLLYQILNLQHPTAYAAFAHSLGYL